MQEATAQTAQTAQAVWIDEQINIVRARGIRHIVLIGPPMANLQVAREALVLPPALNEKLLQSMIAQAASMKLPILCVRIDAWKQESLFEIAKENKTPIIGFAEEKDFQLQVENQSEQAAIDMLNRWARVRIAARILRAPIISTAHELVFAEVEGGNETATFDVS